MKKTTAPLLLLAALLLTAACSNKDTHLLGTEAGRATCDCFRLPTQEATDHCLDSVDSIYYEYLTDSAFMVAREDATLECVNDGVLDLEKPLSDAPKPAPAPADTTTPAAE